MAQEKQCTLLLGFEKGSSQDGNDLKNDLEKGKVDVKASAMKRAIMLLMNGEQVPGLLMHVIRFILPSDDHQLKKLTMLFWEVVEKTDADGKLLPEMILVCNFIRNDLNHPNEYIRGLTLRLLCKLRLPELIEPLIPVVVQNLKHRHSYVRRNAVLTIYAIYKHFPKLMPQAPDTVEEFLNSESDSSSKRNAFVMLYQCEQERAVNYLDTMVDQVAVANDQMQLLSLELIRKVCRSNPLEKSKYMKCILALLSAESHAVVYEAAWTLVSLSSAPTAVRAAATSYTDLLTQESDNNVKLIVLERFDELLRTHSKVLQEMLMDILRALNSPNMDIRRKVLDIALELVTPRNIDEVVHLLKKEIVKTQSKELDKAFEYRQMLVQAVHSCAIKFPEVAETVVEVLMEFLDDSNVSSSVEVILLVRELLETYPQMRKGIMTKLLQVFPSIKSGRVYRVSLWMLGEYSETAEDITQALAAINPCVGEPPFFVETDEEETQDGAAGGAAANNASPTPAPQHKPAVLADGTYATQSAASESNADSAGNAGASASTEASEPTLRSLIKGKDFFLASVLCTTVTKLILRAQTKGLDVTLTNALSASMLLTFVGILKLGQKAGGLDKDSEERIIQCIHVLSNPLGDDVVKTVWLESCRQSFSDMLAERKAVEEDNKKSKLVVRHQVDEQISFRHLKSQRGAAGDVIDDDDTFDLSKAAGDVTGEEDLSTKLSRVTQLTGFSDPVYAEAYVNVHQFDVVLDVLIINQTTETLQNLCLELATIGDLKLVERPQNYTLGPLDNRHIRANIKVSSTETGIIFGNIVYDSTSSTDRNCVILNDIHIDIMDYISPASCTDLMFRTMWAEFEWENKVAVNTQMTELLEFVEHIANTTNMRILTPKSSLEGECGFLAANLYAKSIFNEDALVNVSVEKTEGKIAGYIRIRSKTQGIALSLGDKITLRQKGAKTKEGEHGAAGGQSA